MKDQIKAFVSSTFKDLEQHRAHVVKALRRSGLFVDPMEDWTAASPEPMKFCCERLDGCELCVLLVARRRGYIPDGESKSITQLEYEAAIKNGTDVLVFLLAEDAYWKREWDELDKDEELHEWRAELARRHGVEFFLHDPASIDISPAVTRWTETRRHPASPPVPPPDPVVAPQPPPIEARWTGDGMSVVVRVCRQHAQARSVREALVSQLGLEAEGSWNIPRTIYKKKIVPTIEGLCGKSSCPPPL